MARLYPKEQFHVTRPGQTFVMEGHRLKRVFDETPFLKTTPPETWPARGSAPEKAGAKGIPDYEPATGRREMLNGDNERLEQRLQEFAGALVGGFIFKGLHSLLHDPATGRMLTFALALRNGGNDRRVYEYVPSACAFVQGAPNPEATYLAGMECWGSDLLATLNGDLGAIALNFGRARLWNALPDRFFFDLFAELHRVSHPLRRPTEYLRSYRRLWAKCTDVAPTIFRR
jgi:hypothetical protein